MRLLGIDGCKGGWVVAKSDDSLSTVQFCVKSSFREAVAGLKTGVGLAVVDIPIGLTDAARPCDVAARAFLGAPRSSSVFPAPSRSALTATSYLEACSRNYSAIGKKLSKQCFSILSKIAEVEAFVDPYIQGFVREAHPEVSFAALAGGHGLNHSKKAKGGDGERTGELERLALLPANAQVDVSVVMETMGHNRVSRNDIVDALACLVTADRIRRGIAVTLGAGQTDARGLTMSIAA